MSVTYFRIRHKPTGLYTLKQGVHDAIGKLYTDRSRIVKAIRAWTPKEGMPVSHRQTQEYISQLELVPVTLTEGTPEPINPLSDEGQPTTNPKYGFEPFYALDGHGALWCVRLNPYIAWSDSKGWEHELYKAHFYRHAGKPSPHCWLAREKSRDTVIAEEDLETFTIFGGFSEARPYITNLLEEFSDVSLCSDHDTWSGRLDGLPVGS